MLSLPNLPDEDVVAGGKEQNVPLHYFGEQPKFDFEPKNHVDLCEGLGMIDLPARREGGRQRRMDLPAGAGRAPRMGAAKPSSSTSISRTAMS